MDQLTGEEERGFHHPYEPYDIQKKFMNALYECIEDGKVGIFESPTGTGKSLSLICGSLTWLRDHKRKTFEDILAAVVVDDDEPEWMLEHERKEKKQALIGRRADFESRLAKIRAKEKMIKERFEKGEPQYKRQKMTVDQNGEDNSDEGRFILDDYESDNDVLIKSRAHISADSGLSMETQLMMEKLGLPIGQLPAESEEDVIDEMKIFYCSRTHSQLTQFANELRRVKMPPGIAPEPINRENNDIDAELGLEEEFKHLTLGSRKNLCINPKVNKLGSATAINERCLELQQPGTSVDCKCPYVPTKETEAVVNDFRDHALARIQDIEDLGKLGRKLGICPYYASRPAIRPCEIVTLPYPLLLQKSAREALDLSLKGHVIIIDEAHNLMDAIAGIHSISVSLAQLQRSRAQLGIYLQKFRNKLKGKNRVYVTQTVRLLDSLTGYLQSKNTNSKEAEGLVQIGDLMAGKGVDQINLFKLARYLQDSKLARKVDGYIIHTEQEQGKLSRLSSGNLATSSHKPKEGVPVLTHIQGFLLTLMNPSAEGRFFYSKDDDGIFLKYMLLDPTFHFKEIVQDARAVILAGGTMSPVCTFQISLTLPPVLFPFLPLTASQMSDYEQHLFPYLDSSRITTVSCGHVIPPSNLVVMPIIQGLSGADFDFTFEKRNSESMILGLGNAIFAFIQHIPDGVVVFFPSYSYLDTCLATWKRPDHSAKCKSLWDNINAIKPIFLEQRSQSVPASNTANSVENIAPSSSSAVDSVLSAYSTAIATGNGSGALLLAVIGGTLSEGINFSDSLGRGVIVVGLPFPNPHAAEWKAKMQYITSKAASRGKDGKATARDFYENSCMRAVNQCIGRAIRHRGDYAAILMVDRRYGSPRVQAKLPGWIRGSLKKDASPCVEVGALLERDKFLMS